MADAVTGWLDRHGTTTAIIAAIGVGAVLVASGGATPTADLRWGEPGAREGARQSDRSALGLDGASGGCFYAAWSRVLGGLVR